MNPPRFSSLEILEDRIAPSSTITLAQTSPGVFTLTGDNAFNEISVLQVAPGVIRFEPDGSTALNVVGVGYVSSFTTAKLTSLTAVLGGGDDSLRLSNITTLTALTVDGGTGDDVFTFTNLAVKGDVNLSGGDNSNLYAFDGLTTAIKGNLNLNATTGYETLRLGAEKTTIGGRLLVTGGTGVENISSSGSGSLTISKGVEVNSGATGQTYLNFFASGSTTIGKLASGESLLIQGVAANYVNFSNGDVTLAGGIRIAGSVDDDSFSMSNATRAIKIGKLPSGESIFFDGNAGFDSIALDGMNVSLAGGIRFNSGDGGSRLDLTSPNGKVSLGKLATGQSILMTGGTGDDVISTDVGVLKFSGGIDFTGGAGDNAVNFYGNNGSVSVGKLSTGQSILFTGGADGDRIVSDQALITLSGGIEFAAGDGSNVINLAGGGILKLGTISGGESIKFTGGDDFDRVSIGGKSVTLKGAIYLEGGDGTSVIDCYGTSVNIGKTATGISIFLLGGVDEDLIDLEDNINLAGDLTLDGGAGADQLDLTGLMRLKVGGAVTFTGGAGDDVFDAEVFSLAIAGGITFFGDDDTDTFELNADGTVGGDVNPYLAEATSGQQWATITSRSGTVGGLVVKRAVNIFSAGAAASSDLVTLTNLKVAKAISVLLGAGSSVVNIDNLQGGDLFNLDAGDGADTVNFERLDLFGNSVIAKLATIITGIGDDTLLIGTPLALPGAAALDSTRVRFLGGLTLDGGTGTDTLNDIATENTIGSPGVTGLGTFEVVVP